MDLFKPKRIVSIDIGSRNIKITLLEKKGEENYLKNYSILSLPEKFEYGGFVSFQLEDEVVAQLIGWALREAGISEKNVILTLPFSSSFSKVFQIPPIDTRELKKAINFESRKYIPGKFEEFMTYWEIFKFHDDPKENWSVFLLAFPKTFLEKYSKVANLGKLKVKGFYFENTCIGKLLESPEWVALVDFGHLNSIISFSSKGQVKYSKILSLNGQKLTSLYSTVLSLDFLRAENFKENFGIKIGPENKDLQTSVISFLNNFLTEIEREINDFEKANRVSVEKIYFYGGNSTLKGMIEYFASFFKERKVFILNPFLKIKYPKDLEQIINKRGLLLATSLAAGYCFLNS